MIRGGTGQPTIEDARPFDFNVIRHKHVIDPRHRSRAEECGCWFAVGIERLHVFRDGTQVSIGRRTWRRVEITAHNRAAPRPRRAKPLAGQARRLDVSFTRVEAQMRIDHLDRGAVLRPHFDPDGTSGFTSFTR